MILPGGPYSGDNVAMKLSDLPGSTRQQAFNRQRPGNAVDVARRAEAEVTQPQGVDDQVLWASLRFQD